MAELGVDFAIFLKWEGSKAIKLRCCVTPVHHRYYYAWVYNPRSVARADSGIVGEGVDFAIFLKREGSKAIKSEERYPILVSKCGVSFQTRDFPKESLFESQSKYEYVFESQSKYEYVFESQSKYEYVF